MYHQIGNVIANALTGDRVSPDDTNLLAWLEAGNVLAPPSDSGAWRTQAWADFVVKRDLFRARLETIAGRAFRQGLVDIVTACDSISDGLLLIAPKDAVGAVTTFGAAPSRASLESLIEQRGNQLLGIAIRGGSTDPTTPVVVTIKAALDKVFK